MKEVHGGRFEGAKLHDQALVSAWQCRRFNTQSQQLASSKQKGERYHRNQVTCQPAVPSTAVGPLRGLNLTTLFFDVPNPYEYHSGDMPAMSSKANALSQRARTRPVKSTTLLQPEANSKTSMPVHVPSLRSYLSPFGSVFYLWPAKGSEVRERKDRDRGMRSERLRDLASRIAHEAAALTAKAAVAAAAAASLRWPAQRSCASPTSCRSQVQHEGS